MSGPAPTMALAPRLPVRVSDVHRAALAAAVAGGLAEELGEHAVDGRALGQAVAVPAVGAGDVVVPAQGFADADGDGLLADVQVRQPGHFRRDVQLVDLLFEEADLQHLLVQVQPVLDVKGWLGHFL